MILNKVVKIACVSFFASIVINSYASHSKYHCKMVMSGRDPLVLTPFEMDEKSYFGCLESTDPNDIAISSHCWGQCPTNNYDGQCKDNKHQECGIDTILCSNNPDVIVAGTLVLDDAVCDSAD